MVDDDEKERHRRIRLNAELSLKMSHLPPNMEAQEKLKKEKEVLGLKRSVSAGVEFTFKPPTPKAVPDFKKLQKDFAAKLERNKSA
jgi:hypothetical protein